MWNRKTPAPDGTGSPEAEAAKFADALARAKTTVQGMEHLINMRPGMKVEFEVVAKEPAKGNWTEVRALNDPARILMERMGHEGQDRSAGYDPSLVGCLEQAFLDARRELWGKAQIEIRPVAKNHAVYSFGIPGPDIS